MFYQDLHTIFEFLNFQCLHSDSFKFVCVLCVKKWYEATVSNLRKERDSFMGKYNQTSEGVRLDLDEVEQLCRRGKRGAKLF